MTKLEFLISIWQNEISFFRSFICHSRHCQRPTLIYEEKNCNWKWFVVPIEIECAQSIEIKSIGARHKNKIYFIRWNERERKKIICFICCCSEIMWSPDTHTCTVQRPYVPNSQQIATRWNGRETKTNQKRAEICVFVCTVLCPLKSNDQCWDDGKILNYIEHTTHRTTFSRMLFLSHDLFSPLPHRRHRHSHVDSCWLTRASRLSMCVWMYCSALLALVMASNCRPSMR